MTFVLTASLFAGFCFIYMVYGITKTIEEKRKEQKKKKDGFYETYEFYHLPKNTKVWVEYNGVWYVGKIIEPVGTSRFVNKTFHALISFGDSGIEDYFNIEQVRKIL